MHTTSQLLKNVLITGASAGIGSELSKIFAREGHDLVLVARNASNLEALATELRRTYGRTVMTLARNLAVQAAPDELFTTVQQKGLTIDILVNNAGVGQYGFFAQGDLARQQEMMQLNVVALTHLTRLFLPGMIERRLGKILNVASTAGFQPGPLMAVYYATKAFVLSFSEALANELQGSGVTVTTLCPGPTATEFQQRAQMEKSRLFRGNVMDASTVAECGYRGLMKDKTIVIPGWKNKLLAFSVRFAPRKLVAGMVRKIQSKDENLPTSLGQPHNP
jgi:short-subunit dehydrogenase